jgi:UDP-N-acetylmuramate--alanine ligase
MPGRHNVLNALATVAVSMELGLDFPVIAEGFKDFGGVQRRFQVKYDERGIMVVDDYGHHPAEIKATLAAARAGWKRRVVAVFQPHRYSRTKFLMDDFATAFYQSDYLLVTDIYPAGEEPIPGVDAETLTREIVGHGHKNAHYVADRDVIVAHLLAAVKEGDIVITLGAGDVWKVGESLIRLLKEKD